MAIEILELSTAQGFIKIRFPFEFNDGTHGTIGDISLEAGFELPYKKRLGVEVKNGVYTLFEYGYANNNGNKVETHNYLTDKLSYEIADKVGKKKEQGTPRFGK